MTAALRYLSIAEIRRRLSDGSLRPEALLEAYLSACAAQNGTLSAYVHLTDTRARARALENRDGPLAGVTYGLKDNIDVGGVPTTSASRLLEGYVPGEDSFVAARLEKAGALLLGKLNTYEFGTGTGAMVPDLMFAPARNPYDLMRFSGGSTTGGGVAVAAGLASFAIGTDTGGSIRLPAAACGLAGLKPTFGLVGRSGAQPNCPAFDHIGPIARSAHDVAEVLQVIAGFDPRDGASQVSRNVDFLSGIDKPVEGLRIGVIRRFFDGDVACESAIIDAVENAAAVFRSLGARVTTIDLPYGLLDFRACSRIINVAESFDVNRGYFERDRVKMGAALRDKLIAGSLVKASDYFLARRRMAEMAQAVDAAFAQCDLLLTIGTSLVAPRLDDAQKVVEFTTKSAMAAFNISGHPAISLCGGYDTAGMPTNFQLAAPHWAEALLLRAAHAYEKATRWFRRPPEAAGTPPAYVAAGHELKAEAEAAKIQGELNDAAIERLRRLEGTGAERPAITSSISLKPLSGAVALVTGGARGIGAAICAALAQEGATTIVADVDLAAAEATCTALIKAGGKAAALGLDVADRAACDAAFERVRAEYGDISILVNNAGINRRVAFDDPAAPAAWDAVMAVNVMGMFNTAHAARDQLKRTRGVMVNLASIQSFIAFRNSVAYTASKGAVMQFTKALALEWALEGVRVNAVAPGFVTTDMTRPTRENTTRHAEVLRQIPLGRFADPAEIAAAVVYLCGPGSSYATGTTLLVDGGFVAT